MKVVLALLAGAALGVAATRLRSSAPPPAVTAGPVDPGPARVAVDVSAFGR
ncbi:MAG TPA: hypothetical protein VFU19_16770 [Iamia sp.]|nr:hypothetical protein [Iamia sp.]